MRSPVLSVIVPMFNVEKYIERCVRSLMEQSLQNVEYIFVDDCSTDESVACMLRVLDEYPQRKDHVILYRMPSNSGTAQVRKTGIKLASGEYVIHCDSDDWVDVCMYENMYNKAIQDHCDIIISDFMEETSSTKTRRKCYGGNDLISDCLMYHGTLCCRMVKRCIAWDDRIVWPTENFAEDLVLSVQYSLLSKKYGYVEEPYYHYCRRDSSMLGGRKPEQVIEGQRSYYNNICTIKSVLKENKLLKKYKDELTHVSLGMKNVLLPLLAYDNSNLKLWRSISSETNCRIMFCRLITFREKLNYIVTSLGLYPFYCKLTHRNA